MKIIAQLQKDLEKLREFYESNKSGWDDLGISGYFQDAISDANFEINRRLEEYDPKHKEPEDDSQ